MYSKSDNIDFLIYDNANEVVNELFKSLLSRYQTDLETWMRKRNLTFDSVQLLYYKWQKRKNIYRLPWLDQQKKATINHINKNDKCFQYATAIVLSHEEIGKNPYISKNNMGGINPIILIIISNEEGWHYLAVKKIACIVNGIYFKN